MTNFIWKYKKHDVLEIDKISKDFSVPKSIATIMSLKSITNKDESRSFFYNNLDLLHSPLLMLDMEKAVQRVLAAKHNNVMAAVVLVIDQIKLIIAVPNPIPPIIPDHPIFR